MDLRFVSSNAEKFREVQEILRPFGVGVHWSDRTLPEPQADTLEEVVQAKLAAIPAGRTPVLVEDSGLFLTSLGGFPGVYSAYVYRTVGLAGILRLLEGRSRSASFETVAGVREGRSVWWVRGRSKGRIAARTRGSGGFGYDPIFIPEGNTTTFAEMGADQKNRYSHRGRALRAVGRRLARRVAAGRPSESRRNADANVD